jgi:hypothetical protein
MEAAMSHAGKIHFGRIFLLILCAGAVFGGSIIWESNKTSEERKSYGAPLVARVVSVSKVHTKCSFLGILCASWRFAKVEVKPHDEASVSYEKVELESSVKRGQHLRTWLQNGNSNDANIERSKEGSESYGFMKTPYQGELDDLGVAAAFSMAAFGLGLALLSFISKSSDAEERSSVRSQQEEDDHSSLSPTVIKVIHVMNVLGIIGILAAKGARTRIFHLYAGITLSDLLYASGGIVVVLSIYTGLVKLVPWLSWSWTKYLGKKHEGQNLTTFTMKARWVGPVYTAMLFLGLPLLAKIEEEWFRGGTHGWEQGIIRSFAFGMIHCLVGVPLAAGIAISVFGLWLTQNYFWGGVHQSTEVHTAYNAILVSLFCIGYLLLKVLDRPQEEEVTNV